MNLEIFVIILGIIIGLFIPGFISKKKPRVDVYGNPVKLGSGQMFDTIAPFYDIANRIMSLGFDHSWRNTMVGGLDIESIEKCTKIIDIGIIKSQHIIIFIIIVLLYLSFYSNRNW
jgi:hypothetical protein